MTTFSDRPWDGSASNYSSTEAYCSACLIDENTGDGPKTQANCKLPVREPGGAVNKAALRAAASVLGGGRGGVQASAEAKAAAKRKLMALMSEAGMTSSMTAAAEGDGEQIDLVEELPTVDLDEIEVFAAGGPYHGPVSPRGGDRYSHQDIADMAAAANDLADTIHQPIKLGHALEERLNSDGSISSLPGDGRPALGYLHEFRAEAGRLFAKPKRVPRVVAALMKSGAYRARSMELRKRHWRGRDVWVPDGMALLGAQAPAVKGLADVFSLYAASDDADARVYVMAPPDPEARAALRTELDQTLGAIARAFAHDPEGGTMADEVKKDGAEDAKAPETAEIRARLAEMLGAPEDASDEDLLTRMSAVTASVKETVAKDEAAKDAEQTTEGGEDLPPSVVEALKTQAAKIDDLERSVKAGQEAQEELRVNRRESLISQAIADRKILPSQHDDFVRMYDEAPEMVVRTLELMGERADLKTYGADGGPGDPEREREEALYRAMREAEGRPVEKEG